MSVVAIANLIAASPAMAGNVFDFNLTLPIMAGQFLALMVFLDKVRGSRSETSHILVVFGSSAHLKTPFSGQTATLRGKHATQHDLSV